MRGFFISLVLRRTRFQPLMAVIVLFFMIVNGNQILRQNRPYQFQVYLSGSGLRNLY